MSGLQGAGRALIQAFVLEVHRMKVWLLVLALIFATLSTLGNLSLNAARSQILAQIQKAPLPSQAALIGTPARPTPEKLLTPYTVRLEGFETHPEQGHALRLLLERQGARVTTNATDAAVILQRMPPEEGRAAVEISALNSADLAKTLGAFRVAFAQDEEDRVATFLLSHPEFERAPTVQADLTQIQDQIKQLTQTAPLLLRLFLTIGVVLMMTFIASASLGLEWDLRRAASTLEPWALTPLPTWVLYGSQLGARSLIACLTVLACAGPTLLLTPEISWPWALAGLGTLLVFCLGLSVLVGMWGLLSTMIFHHRYGRMLGRLVLSPISLGALTAFRLSLVVEAMGNADQWLQGRFAETSLWTALVAANVAGLAMVGLGLALMPLVNARIGRRRQGLRKL